MKPSHVPRCSLLLVLVLSLGLVACGKSPEAHFRKGRDFVEQGDFRSAILELKNVLVTQPANSDARLLLALADYRTGAYPEAETLLNKAQELGAAPDQVLPLRALTQVRLGYAQRLLKEAVPSSGLSPVSMAMLLTARAEAQIQTGQRAEAEASLAQAGRLAPDQPDLLFLRAKVAFMDKHPEQASQLVERALQVAPRLVEALYLKAELLQAADKPDDALRVYRQIVAYDPFQYGANVAIASVEIKKGHAQAADKAIQAAEKVAGNTALVNYARATLELQRGKPHEAIAALHEVLRLAPDHVPSLLAYATANYGLGLYENAINAGIKALGDAPDNLMVGKVLASSLLKVGDVEGAQYILAPFLTSHRDDPNLLALAGEAYLQSRNYPKAMGYLEMAAHLDPGNAVIRSRLAAGHLVLGDSDAALADLRQAAGANSQGGQVDLALIMLHLKRREFDTALQAIAALEKKHPDSPVTRNLRAIALLGKRDRAGARAALEQALSMRPTFIPAAVSLARLDLQEHRPDQAGERFKHILAMDQKNAQAMLELAELAHAQGNAQDSLNWLTKAVQADPRYLPARARLVHHYLASHENAKALTQARLAADALLDNPAALNLLGSTQLAVGNRDEAIATYLRLSQLLPHSPEAHLQLGLAQMAAKQWDRARDSFHTSLRRQPDHLQAQVALTQVELLAGRPEAALEVADKIVAQRPAVAIGYQRKGDILMALKRFPQAIVAYRTALAKSPDRNGVTKLHHALWLSGDGKAADQLLSTWLARYPKDWALRTYAAEFYMLTRRDPEAIVQYEELLKWNPRNAGNLNNLAVILQRIKDPRALVTAEQAYRLAPERADVEDTFGWLLVEQGQISRGLELLAKATTQSPKDALLQYHYGAALLRAGKRLEAKKALNSAVANGQKSPERDQASALLNTL
jgi:putative PEP-CTERM system TPR-repeat lipoprotein